VPKKKHSVCGDSGTDIKGWEGGTEADQTWPEEKGRRETNVDHGVSAQTFGLNSVGKTIERA